MLGLFVSVPVACFRKGLAREYLETEPLPPPATCYGMLLALVGETDRDRHRGVRVCPALVVDPRDPAAGLERTPSVVLRTVWRVKAKKSAPGTGTNLRPDFQQLHTQTQLVVWVDSSDEPPGDGPSLEDRLAEAIAHPSRVDRFGGLSLGESTHLVDEVLPVDRWIARQPDAVAYRLEVAERGRITMPVWVDHVGSRGTRHVVADLTDPVPAADPPPVAAMPRIDDGTLQRAAASD